MSADFGNTIRKLREIRNLTQQHMAESLGLSLSGYGKIERSETDLSISRLGQIAEVLGVDISTILNFDEKHIFNFNNTATVNGFLNSNFQSDSLVEELLKTYKEENAYLKGLVNELMSKIKEVG